MKVVMVRLELPDHPVVNDVEIEHLQEVIQSFAMKYISARIVQEAKVKKEKLRRSH